MAWLPMSTRVVGPAASWYTLPRASTTDSTSALGSFQPTTTTLRLPESCAAGYGTVTWRAFETAVECACMKVTRPAGSDVTVQTNEALLEEPPSVAMTVTE